MESDKKNKAPRCSSHDKPPLYPYNTTSVQPLGAGGSAGSSSGGSTRLAIDEVELQRGHEEVDPVTVDEKRLKRAISNRRSAKKLRERKSKQLKELQEEKKRLEEEVKLVNDKIERQKCSNSFCERENHILMHRLETMNLTANLRELQIENSRADLKRLNEIIQLERLATAPKSSVTTTTDTTSSAVCHHQSSEQPPNIAASPPQPQPVDMDFPPISSETNEHGGGDMNEFFDLEELLKLLD